MLVSIIIPTYKPTLYLYECLDSIKSQSFQMDKYEVVVVLNGPDQQKYEDYITAYVSNNPSLNIKLLYSDKQGVSAARNLGIENANGEYITFIDDDDLISENFLSELYAISSETCIGCSNLYYFKDSTANLLESFISKVHSKLLLLEKYNLFDYRKYLSPPVSKLIHTNIIKDTRFDENLVVSEDSVFCFAISKNIGIMRLTPVDCAYYYRRRENSVTNTPIKLSTSTARMLNVEYAYLTVYFSAPLRYNFLLLLSRMVAAIINYINYILLSLRHKSNN